MAELPALWLVLDGYEALVILKALWLEAGSGVGLGGGGVQGGGGGVDATLQNKLGAS